MGADIYLSSIMEKRRAERPGDYDFIYNPICYFRDSYNSSSLYWMLGRSWWQDVKIVFPEDVYDDEGEIKKEHLQTQLERQRKYIFEIEAYLETVDKLFEEWWNKDDKHITIDNDGNSKEDWKRYFKEKLDRWIELLHKADDMGEVLYWSV